MEPKLDNVAYTIVVDQVVSPNPYLFILFPDLIISWDQLNQILSQNHNAACRSNEQRHGKHNMFGPTKINSNGVWNVGLLWELSDTSNLLITETPGLLGPRVSLSALTTCGSLITTLKPFCQTSRILPFQIAAYYFDGAQIRVCWRCSRQWPPDFF